MEFYDRYFKTLRLLLPKDQRDDIIRELAEEIRTQVADREAELGRPLSAEEHAAILKPYGHPFVAAARYRPSRYLIGPAVFPYYWVTLKVVLTLTLIGHLVGAIALIAGGASPSAFAQAFDALISTLLKELGWITLLAAAADFWLTRSRHFDAWRPGAARHGLKLSFERPPSVRGVIVSVVISAWWLLGLKFPSLFFGPSADQVTWGAAMDRLYPVLVVAQALIIARHVARLTGSNAYARVGKYVSLLAGLAFIYLVATADHRWLVWPDTKIIWQVAGRSLTTMDTVNYMMSGIFIAVAFGALIGAMRAMFGRADRSPAPA